MLRKLAALAAFAVFIIVLMPDFASDFIPSEEIGPRSDVGSKRILDRF